MITNEDIDWIRAELNRRVAFRAANGFQNAREEERFLKQQSKAQTTEVVEPVEVDQKPVSDVVVSEVNAQTEDKVKDFSFADEFYDNLVNDVQLYSKPTESEEISAADDITEETYRVYPLVSENIYSVEEPVEFDSRHLKLGQAPPLTLYNEIGVKK